MKREESRQKMRRVGSWLTMTFISLCEDLTKPHAGRLLAVVLFGKAWCPQGNGKRHLFLRGASLDWSGGEHPKGVPAPGQLAMVPVPWKHLEPLIIGYVDGSIKHIFYSQITGAKQHKAEGGSESWGVKKTTAFTIAVLTSLLFSVQLILKCSKWWYPGYYPG